MLPVLIPVNLALVKFSGVGYTTHHSGRSAVWLARTVRVGEVPGSNPGAPTEFNAFCTKLGTQLTRPCTRLEQLGGRVLFCLRPPIGLRSRIQQFPRQLDVIIVDVLVVFERRLDVRVAQIMLGEAW